ncbi:MAG: hypothetical protein Q9202_004973 [Teloschistes flavicans]
MSTGGSSLWKVRKEVLNLRRRDSAGSGESLLGDEELEEEGFGGRERDCDGESRNGVGDGDRRLSLELERGFKDDSESDRSDDERRRPRL